MTVLKLPMVMICWEAPIYYTNHLEKAIIYHEKALDIFVALKDSMDVSSTLINLGNAYSDQGHYVKAIRLYLQSFELQKELKDFEGQSIVLNNIALIFYDQKDFEKSKQYVDQSLTLAKAENLSDIICSGYNLKSELYIQGNDLDSAAEFAQIALRIANENNYELEKASSIASLGLIEAKKGNIEAGIKYCKRAIEHAQSYGDPYTLAIQYQTMTDVYDLGGLDVQCLKSAKKAYEIASNTSKSRFLLKESSIRLSKAYAINGEFEKAYRLYQEYTLYEDTIRNLSIQEKILERDNLLKEKENTILEANVKLEKEASRNDKIVILVSLSLLAIGIGFIVILSFQVIRNGKLNKTLKNKNLIILQNQKEIDIQKHAVVKKNMELNDLIGTKNKLLSILTHDLKQPFNQLHYILELIDLNALKEGEKELLIAELKESLRTTRETTENLLIWSKSQFGGFNMEQEVLGLSEIAIAVKDQLASLFKQAKISLMIDGQESKLNVYADREQLTIAIRNLTSNALKFSKPGDVVTIRIRSNDDKAIIEVIDTGEGMTEEKIKELQDADRAIITPGSISQKGTGLGVLIVNEFIHNNNGRLSISSEIGRGSTFTISLPLSTS